MVTRVVAVLFALTIVGGHAPGIPDLSEGTPVHGTVTSVDFPGAFDWPDDTATISFADLEFLRVDVNVTTSADFTEDTLVLTYENTSSFPDITYPPLTYTFDLQGESLFDVSLVSSTFNLEIVPSFTSSSITLDVPRQNTNPGEVFEAVFQIVTSFPVNDVVIDIKPGSDPNSINCANANEVVTVAVLTTDDFDALSVDHTTVTFEGAVETHFNQKTFEPRVHEDDVDGDGDVDLVFHFRLGDTGLTCSAVEGSLAGETFDGQSLVGVDTVRMVVTG